ncbi:Uncharacterised protein [Mycobacteroides abscessus subsp. abscessus]|nr:Uncharacterised protein [Mycobacteroides abscessus subsp. abscessus]
MKKNEVWQLPTIAVTSLQNLPLNLQQSLLNTELNPMFLKVSVQLQSFHLPFVISTASQVS